MHMMYECISMCSYVPVDQSVNRCVFMCMCVCVCVCVCVCMCSCVCVCEPDCSTNFAVFLSFSSTLASSGIVSPVESFNMASTTSETQQTSEIAEVKEAFPGRCRIIKDIGMFSHVVTLQPKNMDATLKFQLTGMEKIRVQAVCVLLSGYVFETERTDRRRDRKVESGQ